MSAHPVSVRISESREVPLFSGLIEVDTSKGPVTIFMKPGPVHSPKETLIITKVSADTHTISLFSETTLINDADIIIFGLPPHARVNQGKVKTLILKSDGTNWKIIREE
jgi:hypothetical protein